MAPHDIRRPFKRATVSDQQRRREQALLRQAQHRADAQNRARFLATSVLSLQDTSEEPTPEPEAEFVTIPRELDVIQASKLKGSDARTWFSRQLMLPEWMIDVPPHLEEDWYVFPRPEGKRCFVVSSNGTTISRCRNGSMLHRFPSNLPCGARTKDKSESSQFYCILDCIFHEVDQTYYAIDVVCWRGYSLYDCSAEFRFFWLNSKLMESGACDSPSTYHKYRFSTCPVYDCSQSGLQTAYLGSVPYFKDGLLFYNKHAHYQTGNTPLALVWKDEHSSRYFLDTDSKGQVPEKQLVVLELKEDGKVTSSDDPPVVFTCLSEDFILKSNLRLGALLRFAIGDGGLKMADGRLETADLVFMEKSNSRRGFADSYSKVLFQYTARRSPLRFEDLAASIQPSTGQLQDSQDVVMDG